MKIINMKEIIKKIDLELIIPDRLNLSNKNNIGTKLVFKDTNNDDHIKIIKKFK